MAKTIELKVHLAKDDETGRWYIAESDIPGLRVEADTVHDLIRKVEDVAPELIELNSDEIIQAAKPKRHKKQSVSILPVIDTPLTVAVA